MQDYTGLAWLFLGVANSDALLYDDEWQPIVKNFPNNFKLDYALSREQKNKAGGKMYIQDKVGEYADEVFTRMDNGGHMYFCGLKVLDPPAPIPSPCPLPFTFTGPHAPSPAPSPSLTLSLTHPQLTLRSPSPSGVKATLTDGAYHDVDSSVMAFEIAGRQAARQGLRAAGAKLMEPMMKVGRTLTLTITPWP